MLSTIVDYPLQVKASRRMGFRGEGPINVKRQSIWAPDLVDQLDRRGQPDLKAVVTLVVL
eukprot:12271696-Heterocapsa_arctica.AAC.1